MIPSISALSAIVVGKLPDALAPGDTVYLAGDKSYSQSNLVILQLVAQAPSAQVVDTPFSFTVRSHLPISCIGSHSLTLDSLSKVRARGSGYITIKLKLRNVQKYWQP